MAYGKDTKLRSQIMLVKDKVIIITGGAKGIGITLSHKFAEAGAKVIITERDEIAGNKVVAEYEIRAITLSSSKPMFQRT